ncbi:cysteine--tRNA ligase [Candidatus Phytoplasma sacchari]|uniref:Cysteine--tRNA ligase n=1 Tax=Candidatus Phytoplasma sacchari TaxID=2609813 RepID=A0ABY7M1W0_9MOLU|nr:cysteine--tRNA ligase [Candidatus Phytoplasma sacchari]
MLFFYNSLTGKKEAFIPINKEKVNIYLCGPTVYDDLHIGNIRSLIFFDMLKRYLKSLYFEVKLVVNITDIDDKIIHKSLKKKKTEKEISSKYTKAFFCLLHKLDIDTIDSLPLITNNISYIVSYISKLIDKGYAYFTDYGIYFRVHMISQYGNLSKQNLNKLRKNIRKDYDNQKENPEDFILWKKTDIGVTYKSPWFDGRPGWHTECVVLIKKIFNDTIDIHGGGNDLKFPHHENEQAQFFASENKNLANFFIHVNNVEYNNQKMSKSLGNIILAKDLLKKIEPNVLRLFFLSYHFLQPINYNSELIEKFNLKYKKIIFCLNKNNFNFLLNNICHNKKNIFYIKEFNYFMKNNLNTPNVLTLIEKLLKEINKKNKDLLYVLELQNTLIYILNILGIKIILKKFSQIDLKNYLLWKKYKNKKDFKKSDFFRNILKKKGII